ncbi:hypothetical protein HQ571_02050 [Candidatus Kuenenbacteria bacterium]|nr:hypothetical protein [Candidatus Kuenenbacteria bacterium]
MQNKIIDAMKEHIGIRGGVYSDWYFGIARDPRKRLFGDHQVREQEDHWIFMNAESEIIARSVELHFIEVLGVDGGSGGGDSTTVYVYVYKKASHTVE